MEEYDVLIGKTLEEARLLFPENKIRVRVSDGVPQMGTTEVNGTRINVSVQDGIIKNILNMG